MADSESLCRLDDLTRRKLVLAKQLAQIAGDERHYLPGYRSVMSVIGLDLSVESVLHAAVTALAPAKAPSTTFRGLLDQVSELLPEDERSALVPRGHLGRVHDIRNDAQHKAKYPTMDEVNECRVRVGDFLDLFLTRVWGVSVQDLSLADAVRDEDGRRGISEAEAALGRGANLDATRLAYLALHRALTMVDAALVGDSVDRLFRRFDLHRFGLDPGLRDISRAIEGLSQDLDRIQETLLHVALGLDLGSLMRCRSIAGKVTITTDGAAHWYGEQDQAVSQTDAEWVVGYCTAALIEIEQRVGDLEKPFGRDYWNW